MSFQNKNNNLKHLTIQQVVQKSSLRKAIESILPNATQKTKIPLLGQIRSKQLDTLDMDLHSKKKNNLLTNQIYTIMNQTSRTSLSSQKLKKRKIKNTDILNNQKQRNSETLDPEIMMVEQTNKCTLTKKHKSKLNKQTRKLQSPQKNNYLCVKNGLKKIDKQMIPQTNHQQTVGQYQLKNYRTQLHFTGQEYSNHCKSTQQKVHKSQNLTGRTNMCPTLQQKNKKQFMLSKCSNANVPNYQNRAQFYKRMTSLNQFSRNILQKKRSIKSSRATSKTIGCSEKKKYQIVLYNFPSDNQLEVQINKKRIKTTQIDKIKSPSKNKEINQFQKCQNQQKQQHNSIIQNKKLQLVVKSKNKKKFQIPDFIKPSLEIFRKQKQQPIMSEIQQDCQNIVSQMQKNEPAQLITNDKLDSIENHQEFDHIQLENHCQAYDNQMQVVQLISRQLIPKSSIKQKNGQNFQKPKTKIKQKNNMNILYNIKRKGQKNKFYYQEQLCAWKNSRDKQTFLDEDWN